MRAFFVILILNVIFSGGSYGYVAPPGDTLLADRYFAIGDSLSRNLRDYKNSIKYFELARSICKKYGKHRRLIECNIELARAYKELGQYDRSIEMANAAILLSREALHDSLFFKSECYRIIGGTYYFLGKPHLSYSALQKAKEAAEKYGDIDSLKLASIYHLMGMVNARIGRLDPAITNIKKAISLVNRDLYKNNIKIAYMYNNLSLAYQDGGYYDTGIYYLRKAIAIKEREKQTLSSSYNNMGLMYLSKADYNIALQYFNKALAEKTGWDDRFHDSGGHPPGHACLY